jgi:hypothetical protein
MARRCCKDTIAWEDARGVAKVDGLEVPCRWCDSFATWRDGVWEYSDDLPAVHRIVAKASPALTEHRAKRIKEILK